MSASEQTVAMMRATTQYKDKINWNATSPLGVFKSPTKGAEKRARGEANRLRRAEEQAAKR